jgi:hypothetical protein
VPPHPKLAPATPPPAPRKSAGGGWRCRRWTAGRCHTTPAAGPRWRLRPRRRRSPGGCWLPRAAAAGAGDSTEGGTFTHWAATVHNALRARLRGIMQGENAPPPLPCHLTLQCEQRTSNPRMTTGVCDTREGTACQSASPSRTQGNTLYLPGGGCEGGTADQVRGPRPAAGGVGVPARWRVRGCAGACVGGCGCWCGAQSHNQKPTVPRAGAAFPAHSRERNRQKRLKINVRLQGEGARCGCGCGAQSHSETPHSTPRGRGVPSPQPRA